MYLPKHYEAPGTEALHRLIADYPLGALVVNGPGGLDANHLPFELQAEEGGHGRLIAHVARANPLWKEVPDGSDALVIFRESAGAYVSPNWYPSKHEQHRQVPTWNYRVVHVHGRLRIRDDEKFVRGVVARLTRRHEAQTGDARPWKMSDSSKEYIDQMVGMIVGIELEIARLVGKWKLSQNREQRDLVNAAEELRKRGARETADAMLETLKPR
jgi:transcriptional regulator